MGKGQPDDKKSRRAQGRFRRFVKDQPEASGSLPLVHTTRAYAFDNMLECDALEPSRCSVFQEELIYFFYGRPAYRAKDGNNARLEFEWPIIFLFDPDKIEHITRVFPFDSGAFALKLYDEFFDKESTIEDFELEPTLSSVRKIVGGFYSTHREYYEGSTRKNVELGNREFEAQGVYELARLPGVQGGRSQWRTRDERSSAIEVQVGEPVPFKGALIGIVLPQQYLGDEEVRSALARWNVDAENIETYATLHNMSGEVWVGQIYEIVRKLCRRRNLL